MNTYSAGVVAYQRVNVYVMNGVSVVVACMVREYSADKAEK